MTTRQNPSVRSAAALRRLAPLAALVSGAPVLAQSPVWVATYNGPASHQDKAACVLADNTGVYVAGTSYSAQSSTDFTILRYSRSGELLWERHFDGSGGWSDDPFDMVAHPAGGIVVVGFSEGQTGREVATLRYSADGELLWEHHRPLGGFLFRDFGPQAAIAPDGTVYVASANDGDYLALAYAFDGDPLWERQVDLSGGFDYATGIAVDANGDIYVAGMTGDGSGGYSTIKLDMAGNHLWTHNELGALGSMLGPAFIEPSPDGTVIVSGVPETTCGLFESRTWKLAPDGTEVWMTVFPPEPCSTVDTAAMAVGADGSVVIFAQSMRPGESGSFNYGLLKLDGAGRELWWRFLDGPGNSTDIPEAMALDERGNVHIAGMSWVGGGAYDTIVATYSPRGVLRAADRFDRGSSTERPGAAGVSPRGELYVAGSYQESGQVDNIFVLKYARPLLSIPAR